MLVPFTVDKRSGKVDRKEPVSIFTASVKVLPTPLAVSLPREILCFSRQRAGQVDHTPMNRPARPYMTGE
jgi:hypothetical protein